MDSPRILFIMGVSGSGKSTIGKLLALTLNIPFFDGDDYHSKANIEKMSLGNPLSDNDRIEWLQGINSMALKNCTRGAVIACSALKESYRLLLSEKIEEGSTFVYLKGSFEEVLDRLQQRKGHFMPINLLKSQFEVLEQPKKAIIVSIKSLPHEIVEQIKTALDKNY
ncbi:MAG: gluconokinase [Flavobacteriaceae bacterium]